MRAACRVAPGGKAIAISGFGTSTAGLTCAATRLPGSSEWSLEPGALVLADSIAVNGVGGAGLCVIDDFGQVKAADRRALHEALEQQHLSVAKAGLICQLPCRCSVIAACTVNSTYNDSGDDIQVNGVLEGPLLSRFDLVLRVGHASNSNACMRHIVKSTLHGVQPPWDERTLKAYLQHCRTFQPNLESGSNIIRSLTAYFNYARREAQTMIYDEGFQARTTHRLMEGLKRLTEAHARLNLRGQVSAEDVKAVIQLVHESLFGSKPLPPLHYE